MKQTLIKIIIISLFLIVIIQLNNTNNLLRLKSNSNTITKDQKYTLLSKVTTDIQIDYLKKVYRGTRNP